MRFLLHAFCPPRKSGNDDAILADLRGAVQTKKQPKALGFCRTQARQALSKHFGISPKEYRKKQKALL